MAFSGVFILVVVILLIVILMRVNRYNAESKNSLLKLESKLDRLQKLLEDQKTAPAISETPVEKPVEEIIPLVEQPVPVVVPVPEAILAEETVEEEPEFAFNEADEVFSSPEFANTVLFTNEGVTETPPVEKIRLREPVIPEKSWLTKFKEENPDIEKFIGENLINKIGILILVLGVSFFVKYAIDKDWIGEPARVGIGLLAGALVLGVAHRLKANYKAFSSVFVAGAFAIFYFTIGIAFQEYHLFSQTVAFVIMIVITIFSSFISISYDRQELGVMTLIAGFAVPFMVSTGEGNYIVLLTYIAILNVGMLLISYYKKWNIVNVLAFAFTCILFVTWWLDIEGEKKIPHRGGFVFAALFYIIFSIATVINNLRSTGTFSKIQYGLIVANTFFFFGMGMLIINSWGIPMKGLFTVGLALYNLVFATVLYRKFKLNKNAVYLLIGLTLTFATLTIPIQFSGNYITVFWACEAVLLFWFAQKSRIEAFRWSGIIVQTLMIISLIMDWQMAYSVNATGNEIVHPIFITGLVTIVSLIYTYFLLRKENEIKEFFSLEFNPTFYRALLLLGGILVTYFVGILETSYQANVYNDRSTTVISYIAVYHYLFSIVLIYVALKRNSDILKKGAILLGCVNVILYMVYFGNLPIADLDYEKLENVRNTSAYIIHFIFLSIVAFFIYLLVSNTLRNSAFDYLKSKYALWVLAFVCVFILSQEMIVQGLYFHQVTGALPGTISRSRLETQMIKVGFPILWGVISFGLLIIGIKKDSKQMRIIALSLLGITILKLFMYDINEASETGKIIAFILLGVLILIISFVYQKLKKLIVDESKKTDDDEIL